MWFVWDNKGWTFLILAIVLAGIGGAMHFSPGVGFMMSATGFLFASLISAVISTV